MLFAKIELTFYFWFINASYSMLYFIAIVFCLAFTNVNEHVLFIPGASIGLFGNLDDLDKA